MSQPTPIQSEITANRNTYRLGFWMAILTTIVPLAAMILAMSFAPPRSGPNCTLEFTDVCIEYPYTDAAAYIPSDYLWMYPAALMGPVFILLIICIHQRSSRNIQVFTQIALALGLLSTGALFINYFIQLKVVIPSLLLGETDGLTLLSQYNPHGVFIALEDIGYLLMGAAFLFIAPAFVGGGKLNKSIRLIFATAGILAVGSFVVMAPLLGSNLEYHYEVVSIVIDWIALIIAGGLLAAFFRREARQTFSDHPTAADAHPMQDL